MEQTLGFHMTEVIHFLSRRWTMFVIYKLQEGPQRFSEIESGMPISGRLLSERLKELEATGIVTRRIFAEVPVRVEYELTEKGRAFQPILAEIKLWSDVWGGTMPTDCKEAVANCTQEDACKGEEDPC